MARITDSSAAAQKRAKSQKETIAEEITPTSVTSEKFGWSPNGQIHR